MKRLIKIFFIFLIVFTLTGCQEEKVLTEAFEKLTIDADLDNVNADLNLVSQIGEVKIEWKSSNEGVITPDGRVILRDGERLVRLTATLSYNGKTKTKVFNITVPSKTIDPIVPIKPIEPDEGSERLLSEFKKWLNERLAFAYVTHDIDLPTTHPVLGGEVEWKTSNESAITNAGRVNRGNEEQKVTLTAVIKIGNSSLELNFEFTVLNNDIFGSVEMISNIRKKPIDSEVVAIGVVTEVTPDSAYIQDTTGAIHLFLTSNSNFDEDFEEGNLVKVTGKLTKFNGLLQISSLKNVEVLETAVQQPKIVEVPNLSNETLKDLESMKISVNNATITKLPTNIESGKDNFIEISDGTSSINIFIKKNIEKSIIDELNNKLKWFRVGEEISINGVMVGNYNGYQFVLTSADNIIDKKLTTEQQYEAVKNSLADLYALDGVDLKRKFNFITHSIYNSKITYEFSHPEVLAVGVFNQKDIDVVVQIKFIIEIDNQTFPEETIMVTVKAKGEGIDPIDDLSEYYKSAEGLDGAALKNQLNRIVSSGVKSISYKETSYVLDETDVDPNNSKNVLLIYNRASVSGIWNGNTWNKEHVWPQSKLGSASKSDIHNLRPANPTINSNRGNLPFAEGSGTYGKVTGGWFPGEEDKGDVARIVLYMHVRWNLEITKGGIGDLQMLLRWHEEDPVDDFETNRNNVIFQYQKNRNPFIDYPQFVDMIWGTMTQTLSVQFGIITSEVFAESKITDLAKCFETCDAFLNIANYNVQEICAVLNDKKQYI